MIARKTTYLLRLYLLYVNNFKSFNKFNFIQLKVISVAKFNYKYTKKTFKIKYYMYNVLNILVDNLKVLTLFIKNY